MSRLSRLTLASIFAAGYLAAVFLAAVFLAVGFVAGARAAAAAPARPLNVLFIVADDLRTEFGAYGSEYIKSPHLDRLGASGRVFDRAYCQQAVCSPSRTSLLTGCRPDTTHIYDLKTHFRKFLPNVVTLPQYFKQHGYSVVGMGKIFHGGLNDPPSWSLVVDVPQPGTALGYRSDEAYESMDKVRLDGFGPPYQSADVPDNGYRDGVMGDLAVSTLAELKKAGKPFFLAVGFYKPHLPFTAPKKYWDLYSEREIALAPNPFPPHGSPPIAWTDSGELRRYVGMPAKGAVQDDQARKLKHGYFACISYVDAQVGRVLDQLDQLGLSDSTIVVLWGDHGWKLGEHGMWCKHTNYENDTHAPLIVRAPGMKAAGRHTSALVEFVDVYPSLCDLAGLPKPAHLEGDSFVPLLTDPQRPWKSAAFSQYPRHSPQTGPAMGYSMRTDRWHLVRWVKGHDPQADAFAVELYDQQNDPLENQNVAADPANATLLKQLTAKSKAGWQAARPPASGARAAEASSGVQPGKERQASSQWKLSTDDTAVIVSVSKNRIFISSLKNPAQQWDWVPAASECPLPGADGITTGRAGDSPNWTFCDATEDRSDGHTVTLRFISTTPNLELKSVWRAHPGPGPVENSETIENKSGGNVTFGPNIVAGCLQIKADHPVKVHRAEKTNAGKGKVHYDPLGSRARITTDSRTIPLILLDVESRHGMYVGYEWELGGFQVTSGSDPRDITVSVHPITEKVTRGDHAIFTIPSVYFGTYQGDIDDGSNRFKKWFWNHKITRSLHDHTDEPWVEMCIQKVGGKGNDSISITGRTPQSLYDLLASNGVEAVKMDFWDGTGGCWYTDRDWMYHPAVWPHGFDYALKAHRAGLKASLYMGGTYRDCDLTTIAGRDAELAAVLKRFDQGWFDIWRTDLYSAPREPMPQTYDGVANFLYIQDQMIKNRPGYRYENCCNGGKYKGFAICRRMTFCTMNDRDQDPNLTRSTYYSDSFAINPVQLKSDLCPNTTAFDLRTVMLGAILTLAADNPVYRQHISLYKTRQRPILRGADVYHILPMADGVNWDGLEYFNTAIRKGSVFLFKPSAKAVDGDSKVIKLKGLDRSGRYTLTFQDRTNLNCAMTGGQLMDAGIAVTGMAGDRASEIIWIDGPERPTASR